MTAEIWILFTILAGLIILFVTEIFPVDVIAILCMLSLVWTGLLTPSEAFSGFSGSAVISVIAVMIVGYGIEQSGLMNKVAKPIVRLAGNSENRLITLVSLTVGAISSIMQNIGAAALFLPALRRISREAEVPAFRLLMPMGFATLLGGTLTMIGSGPLILLSDLMTNAGLEAYSFFDATPVGLILLLTGVLYFLMIGKRLLPKRSRDKAGKRRIHRTQRKLITTLNLNSVVFLAGIPKTSTLVGKTREESGLWENYKLNLLAIVDNDDIDYAPWRMKRFDKGQNLALFGCDENIDRFVRDYGLVECHKPGQFESITNPETAGFAELLVRPGSKVAGKTLRQISLRKHLDIEPVMMLKGFEEIRGDFSDIMFEPGDVIIVYGHWNNIENFNDSEDFILSSEIEGKTPKQFAGIKVGVTVVGVLAAILLGVKLSVALFSGVMALVLLKCITMEEAYKAVDWRTVFLIAGLIPIGIAMEKTEAALLIANQMMTVLKGSPVFVIMLAVTVMTMVFSLFMSSYAATVLLVPLVINIANSANIPAEPMALLVALSTANSFVLPTHQVNAFLMSPGGYKISDYIKTGGLLSIIFILVCTGTMYLLFF